MGRKQENECKMCFLIRVGAKEKKIDAGNRKGAESDHRTAKRS